jgi:non-canonical purine NTP pyrophosphatase (RdgB/HAM1 family)
MIVYCATSNPGKLREFQLAAPDFDVRPLPVKAPPPEEHGATFEENAASKAEYYGQFVDGYLFADDSGLEVDALAGAPGVHSARYAGEHATDQENNALLLERLKGAAYRSARFVCVIALVKARTGPARHLAESGSVVRASSSKARTGPARPPEPPGTQDHPAEHALQQERSVVRASSPENAALVKTFRGVVEGRILHDARGAGGFGYDPLFYYEPFGCTFGEAPLDRKMRVSHRAQALEAMFTLLRNSAAI